jgi:hypothetical protein
MSFSKLSYDNCAYATYLNESLGSGKYMLNAPSNSCGENCFEPSPYVRLGKTGVAVSKNHSLIDIDSELLGLNMKNSKCPSKRGVDSSYTENNELQDCNSRFIHSEDTKISNPPCTLRGTGWNRFDFLHENPQNRAMLPFPNDIQNRLIVKDNHRPCIPKPASDVNVRPADDGSCYTDLEHLPPAKFNEEKLPFIHWRSCSEIGKL